ncbi:hypothetical protein [Desulfonema magnum]|uniref:Lipoprotein n=1 Tax=Desulfonema magnum TaxID=45655 RepID=A0A975BNH9_9BACT|nr:hypothetical protein [Desulfonema magnum]QTA88748.1 Uncharacterized protein dnm_047950 [Desulfonema magnum]
MKRFIWLSSIILMLLFMGGCYTQTPKPATYQYSTQQKMQAAYHWDVLAEDVACQIKMNLKKKGYLNQPVYIRPACGAPMGPCDRHYETPFDEGFYDLLLTHLVRQGMRVSNVENNALVVTNKVQVVYHRENRLTRTLRPGFMTAVGALASAWALVVRDAYEYGGGGAKAAALAGAGLTGIALYDAASGMFTKDMPHSEVIITTSIRDYDRYLMRKTDIYYINDADYWHYKRPPLPQIIEVSGS